MNNKIESRTIVVLKDRYINLVLGIMSLFFILFFQIDSSLGFQTVDENFSIVLKSDGAEPWSDLDTGGTNGIIRTFDMMQYDVKYTRTGLADQEILMTVKLGSFTLPATYLKTPGDAYYADHVEQFTYASLIPVVGGCQRPSETVPATGNPGMNSYISADKQTLYCYLPVGQTVQLPIDSWISSRAPNGTLINPPVFTIQPVGGTILEPVSKPTKVTTVAAKPSWDIRKTLNWKGAQMIPMSGPNKEDGFIFPYHVEIMSVGTRKGNELLQTPIVLTDNYSDPDFPGLRLVTWDIQNFAFDNDFRRGTAASNFFTTNYCVGLRNSATMTGNWLDQAVVHVRDADGLDQQGVGVYSVTNGGKCAITAHNDGTKTFTMEITDPDMTLDQYPMRYGIATSGRDLVTIGDLDDPRNEFWVVNKWYLLWAPKESVPLEYPTPASRELTNSMTIDQARTKSITGAANLDKDLTNNSASYSVLRRYFASVEKMSTAWRWNNPYRWLISFNDPNETFDSIVNQVTTDQYYASYMRVMNTGTESIGPGMFCDKFDNSRVTFVDVTHIDFACMNHKDEDTGVCDYFISGGLSQMVGYNVQIGISTDTAGTAAWYSMNNVKDEYTDPALSGSEQSDSGCGDADAIWFDSVQQLKLAGHSVSEINKVRLKWDRLDPGLSGLFFVPLRVLPTYAYSGFDLFPSREPFVFGNSTMGSMIPNQAFIYSSDHLPRQNESDAVKIIDHEWVGIQKTSSSHPVNNGSVAPLEQVTFKLQVSVTTNSDDHLADVTVWDVLPKGMKYAPGSSDFGGVIDEINKTTEPTCMTTGLPTDIFPNGIPSGYTACRWYFPNQRAVHANYQTGRAAGNLPLLTFRAVVDVDVEHNKLLYNTAFATSTNNDLVTPVYVDEAHGFRCKRLNDNCSRGDYALVVNRAQVHVYQKFTDTLIVGTDSPFRYMLYYGAGVDPAEKSRVLDILPWNNEPIRVTGFPASKFSGTAKLSSWLTPPVASAGPPATLADPDIKIYYSKRTPSQINKDPYHTSQCFNESGTCDNATQTIFCTQTEIQSGAFPNCPASLNDVTAFLLIPKGHGNINIGEMFTLNIQMSGMGNQSGNLYSNNYGFATPINIPTYSNVATVIVAAPDSSIIKYASTNLAQSNERVTYTIIGRNTAISNTLPIPPGTEITIRDTIPAELTFNSVSGSGWDCVSPGTDTPPSTFECSYTVPMGSMPIPAGGIIGSPINVETRVKIGTPETVRPILNRACISVAGDASLGNNCTQYGINIRKISSYMMELDKSVTNLDPTVYPDGFKVGDRIKFLLRVTNTGYENLTNVTLTDSRLALESCEPNMPPVASLAPAETIDCIAYHTVTQADFDYQSFLNTATAGSAETDPILDHEVVTFNAHPALEMTKTALPPAVAYQPEDLIRYAITIHNAGDITLTQVQVTDPDITDLTCAWSDPAKPNVLAIDETVTCSGTHPITLEEFLSGSFVNTATATARQVEPVTDSAEVTFNGLKGLTIEKILTSEKKVYELGEQVTYDVVVTNGTSITLTNVTIVDPAADSITCDIAVPADLEPGQTITCQVVHTINLRDVSNGMYRNVATVDSDETDPVSDEVTVDIKEFPELPSTGFSQN